MTKDEYEDFVLRYKGCGACFPIYISLSRFEKKWFSAIQKDVADLEKGNKVLAQNLEDSEIVNKSLKDKIEDIKANCDFVIEGKDVEIMELTEKYNKQKEINKELVNENESLKEENMKLKCCANCKHFLEICEVEPAEQGEMKDIGFCHKWELAE